MDTSVREPWDSRPETRDSETSKWGDFYVQAARRKERKRRRDAQNNKYSGDSGTHQIGSGVPPIRTQGITFRGKITAEIGQFTLGTAGEENGPRPSEHHENLHPSENSREIRLIFVQCNIWISKRFEDIITLVRSKNFNTHQINSKMQHHNVDA